MQLSQLHTAALTYAKMGLAVFPLKPKDKVPATAHGFKNATTDSQQINRWWTENSQYNIGIATGNGFFVLDLDEKKGKHGLKAIKDLEPEGEPQVQTWICSTPSGGQHRYYKCTTSIKNSESKLANGIDIRGEGGYVVAPPSISADGIYRWLNAPVIVNMADAPVWLLSQIQFAQVEGKVTQPFSMPEEIPEGQRTSSLIKLIGSLQAKGLSDEAIRVAVTAENETRCNPPLSDDELEKQIFPALSRWAKGTAPYTFDAEYNEDIEGLIEHLKGLHPESNKSFGWNDAGNGNLFTEVFRNRLHYVPERKKWFYFDGTRWIIDTGNVQAMNQCKNLANALMRYACESITDEKQRSDYIKHIVKWQGYKYRETILKDAATVSAIPVSEFDSNPYLFNCLNGTLDLKSRIFREHNAADLITMVSGVNYDPLASCKRWEQFISEITCGDNELAKYIQKALGYALTGDTRFECFFILYGATSRNGKGTLCETYLSLVGGYGKTATPESVATRKHSDSRSPSEDIARLVSARFVNMSEPDKHMQLDAARVKTLTGNDTIVARFLGEGSFEYKPQFKMFINTNHIPYISDSTLFTSGRVKVIPFKRHFTEAERDTQLKHKLTTAESLSGILNWCITGLRLLNKEGFALPDCVKNATEDYRADSDKAGQFISECMIENSQGEVRAKMVHTAYQEWCYANGYKPEGYNEFRKSLASAGIEIKRKRPNGADRRVNPERFIVGYELQNIG